MSSISQPLPASFWQVWEATKRAEGAYSPPKATMVGKRSVGGDGYHTLFGITDKALAPLAKKYLGTAMTREQAGMHIHALSQALELGSNKFLPTATMEQRKAVEIFRDEIAPRIMYNEYVQKYGFDKLPPALHEPIFNASFNMGPAGALYVLDTLNHTLRGISPAYSMDIRDKENNPHASMKPAQRQAVIDKTTELFATTSASIVKDALKSVGKDYYTAQFFKDPKYAAKHTDSLIARWERHVNTIPDTRIAQAIPTNTPIRAETSVGNSEKADSLCLKDPKNIEDLLAPQNHLYLPASVTNAEAVCRTQGGELYPGRTPPRPAGNGAVRQ